MFRRGRGLLVLCASICAAAVVLPSASRARNPERQPSLHPGSLTGAFESCDPQLAADSCGARLRLMAHTGMQLTVSDLPSDGPWLAPYLRALRAAHMRAIWEVINPTWWDAADDRAGHDADLFAAYGSWASACGNCHTNGRLLAFITRTLTAGHLTYGWYVADDSEFDGRRSDTRSEMLTGIRAFAAALHADAPGTVTVMSAYGTEQLTEAKPAAGMTAVESYPVIERVGGRAPTTHAVYRSTLQTARRAAAAAGSRPTAMILQAFSWAGCDADQRSVGASGGSPYPTAAQLAAQRTAAVRGARPSLILYYNFDQTAGWPSGQRPVGCRQPPHRLRRLRALRRSLP
jgi:hypothetical protein